MHFYCPKTGEPRYFVEMKCGKQRSSTTRDARKHNWLPSVSTVMGVHVEDSIINYMQEQIIDAAWLYPYTCGADVKEWKKKIRYLSKQHKEKASSDGSRIHKVMEDYYLTKSYDGDLGDLDFQIMTQAVSYLYKKFPNVDWKPELTFCHEDLGYGGCVDLTTYHSEGVIIDFKTQSTGDIKNFKYYDKYILQLAAYREGLGLPNARCFIMKISSTHPGVMELKEYSNDQLNKAFERFKCLLQYYTLTYLTKRDK